MSSFFQNTRLFLLYITVDIFREKQKKKQSISAKAVQIIHQKN